MNAQRDPLRRSLSPVRHTTTEENADDVGPTALPGNAVRWATSRRGLGTKVVARLDALLTPDRVRNYPLIIIVVWLLVFVTTWLATSGNILLPDYTSRWTGGRMLLDGQAQHLYDPAAQWAVQQSELGVARLTWFVSPPYVAALFAPLAALPYALSCLVWTCITLGALWGAMRLLRPYAPAALTRKPVITALVLAASYAVFYLVAGGQDSAIVLLAVAGSIRLLDSRRDVAAGAVLALGLVKPHLIFLLPLVFLLHRRPQALISFAAVGASLAGVSVILVGTSGVGEWLRALSSPLYADQVVQGQAWLSTGLPAFLSALLPSTTALAWQPLLTAVGAVLALVSVVMLWRRPRDVRQTWAVLILTITLTSPHFMVYDLVLTFAALPYLASVIWSGRTRVVLASGYFALWLVPVIHAAATHLAWPATVIQAPWSAIAIAVIWFSLLLRPGNGAGRLASTRRTSS